MRENPERDWQDVALLLSVLADPVGTSALLSKRDRQHVSLLAHVDFADEWTADGHMPVGSVPSDWRQHRTAVRVKLTHGTRFIDIDSPQTHQFFRKELALGLSTLSVKELDVSTVRGDKREVTQMISEWVYRNGDGQGGEVAGI